MLEELDSDLELPWDLGRLIWLESLLSTWGDVWVNVFLYSLGHNFSFFTSGMAVGPSLGPLMAPLPWPDGCSHSHSSQRPPSEPSVHLAASSRHTSPAATYSKASMLLFLFFSSWTVFPALSTWNYCSLEPTWIVTSSVTLSPYHTQPRLNVSFSRSLSPLFLVLPSF